MTLKNKTVIALTGATGFLGSHLMAGLIQKDYIILAFGRAAKNDSLKDRISRLLKWFGLEKMADQVICIDTDLSLDDLGIPMEEYSRLCSITDSVIHCASDTSFSERKREKVMAANIHNLKGILEFSKKAQVHFFHYVSTAYVAGKGVTDCKETLSTVNTFINVYEESKAAAENIISTYCDKNKIPLSIMRPSIVYGDSQTGRSLKFNALYFPIRSAQAIKDIFLNDIKNNGGLKAAKNGIFIDEEGFLNIPLKIYLPYEGDINIIPVDYFVNATIKIIENCSGKGIYHLTNPHHTTMKTVVRFCEQLMKVRGAEVIYGQKPSDISRNSAEELFDRFIEPYRPYLSDNRIFDRTNTIQITDNLNPPEFTYDIFKICMEYAFQVNWGELLFE